MRLAGLLRRPNAFATTRSVEKSVVISGSHDIYTNLALEDWFYRNYDFTNRHMLMLWTNKPCVVIGKFQNPWLECNVSGLDTLIPTGVRLARRNSGGGTVYHDLGNLNLTFFTPRDDYKRVHNLETITRAVLHRFGLKIDVSSREDLVSGEFKVSGTAAKLGRKVAYHHCTMLVDADEETLSKSLRKPSYIIETKATESIRSKIKNLSDLDRNVNVAQLIACISDEYLSSAPYVKGNVAANVTFNRNIKYVDPSEDAYPGILDLRDELKSFDWVFGKTPTFRAKQRITLENNPEVTVVFTVEKGVVSSIELETEGNVSNFDNIELFKDRKFHENFFSEAADDLLASVNLRNSIKT